MGPARHGFKSTINDKILGFAPHVTVTSFGDQPLYRADTLYTYLNRYPEIQAKQIITQGEVMVQTKNGVTGTILKGVDGDEISNLSSYIQQGSFDLSFDETGYAGIILGEDISSTLNADIGDIITVYTITGNVGITNSPEIQQFRLTGIYETGIDLTPMLDVVFIMLIFFIVTTSFVKESGIQVNRPSAATAEKKERANNY